MTITDEQLAALYPLLLRDIAKFTSRDTIGCAVTDVAAAARDKFGIHLSNDQIMGLYYAVHYPVLPDYSNYSPARALQPILRPFNV